MVGFPDADPHDKESDSRMSDERRYLSLRELQEVTLEILLEFDAFCKKHGIEYMLCGGTMLGAARHQGFIPWDDDIDLMMMRDEYERLLDLAPAVAQHPGRKLVSCRDRTFARDYARYLCTEYGKDEEGVADHDCPWLGIDIFPIDFIPDDQSLFERQVKDRRPYVEAMVACSTRFNAGSSFVKKWGRNVLRPFAKMYGAFRAAEKSRAVCMRYADSPQSDIAIVCGMYGTRERWPRSACHPLTTLSFEGHDLPVPHGYGTYLSRIYGADYMDVPPKEKQRPPHIRIWPVRDGARMRSGGIA